MPRMTPSSGLPPFLFLGNHPCLDFVNTEMMWDDVRADLIGSVPDLFRWMTEAKLLTREEAQAAGPRWPGDEGDRLLAGAWAYRAQLRAMASKLAARQPVPASVVKATNEWLRARVGYPELVRAGGGYTLEYRTKSGKPAHPLCRLAERVAEFLSEADLSLVRKCANERCILYFYDTTKNHGRHWCSMEICGNRMKVAAHYRRHRAKEGGTRKRSR